MEKHAAREGPRRTCSGTLGSNRRLHQHLKARRRGNNHLYPYRCGRQIPAAEVQQKQAMPLVFFARTFAKKNPSHPIPMWVAQTQER